MQFGFTEAANVNISSVKSLLTEHHDLALTAREQGGDGNGTCSHRGPLYPSFPLSVLIVTVTDDATKEARGCDTPSLRSAWPVDRWDNWKPRSCQGTWGERLWRKDLRAEGSVNLVRVGAVTNR